MYRFLRLKSQQPINLQFTFISNGGVRKFWVQLKLLMKKQNYDFSVMTSALGSQSHWSGNKGKLRVILGSQSLLDRAQGDLVHRTTREGTMRRCCVYQRH